MNALKNDMKLYHYTKKSSFEKIWDKKTLKFSDTQRTNDIFERSKLVNVSSYTPGFIDKSGKSIFMNLFYKILFNYRQISLSMDYDGLKGCLSPMMWGHYGNNANGVCIELDSKRLIMPEDAIWYNKVEYLESVPFIDFGNKHFNNNDEIKSFIESNIDDFFFKKHIHWKAENEYRIISNMHNYLSIENAITAIYITDVKGHTFQSVKRLVQNEVPIFRIFQSILGGHNHLSFYKL